MRKFLGVILIMLGVLTSMPVLVLWSVRGTLLTSQPWKAALVEARVYERALDELPVVILSNQKDLGQAIASTPLSAADMAGAVQAIVPASLLQDTVERSLDLAFMLVRNETQWANATLVVPLQDIKRRAPIEAQDLLMKKVQALPTCTDAQSKAYEQRKALDGALPPCKPKGLDVRALVTASVPVREITKAVPDTIDLVAEIKKSADKQQPCPSGQFQATAFTNSVTNTTSCEAPPDIAAKLNQAQDGLATGFQLHLLLTLLSAAFFLGAFLIFLPRLRSSFRWFGVGVAIAGLLNVVLALEARSLMKSDLPQPADQLGQAMLSIFEPVGRNLGNQLLQHLLFTSVIILLVGIIAYGVSYAWKPKGKL
ncbi:MAG: hypothetical protein AAB515_03790 [Patescibacteria group bacterium]